MYTILNDDIYCKIILQPFSPSQYLLTTKERILYARHCKKFIFFHCSIPVSFKRGRYTYGLCEYNTLIKINKLYNTSFLPKNLLYNHIFFFIGGF